MVFRLLSCLVCNCPKKVVVSPMKLAARSETAIGIKKEQGKTIFSFSGIIL